MPSSEEEKLLVDAAKDNQFNLKKLVTIYEDQYIPEYISMK